MRNAQGKLRNSYAMWWYCLPCLSQAVCLSLQLLDWEVAASLFGKNMPFSNASSGFAQKKTRKRATEPRKKRKRKTKPKRKSKERLYLIWRWIKTTTKKSVVSTWMTHCKSLGREEKNLWCSQLRNYFNCNDTSLWPSAFHLTLCWACLFPFSCCFCTCL